MVDEEVEKTGASPTREEDTGSSPTREEEEEAAIDVTRNWSPNLKKNYLIPKYNLLTLSVTTEKLLATYVDVLRVSPASCSHADSNYQLVLHRS